MRVLIDTQTLVQGYIGDEPLPGKVTKLLSNRETIRLVSSISIMEIALKHTLGKLRMGPDETREAIRDLQLQVIPFSDEHAFRLYSLPFHHRDPFDRMIIAAALVEGVPLIGADREFRKYKGLKMIW
jgi:PIN domain nuclease of toxin-antitoxin system